MTQIVIHPFKIAMTQSLWCSAACPIADKTLFALGTSDGLHTLEGEHSYWTISQMPLPRGASHQTPGFRRYGNSSHASVQAVEWLSPDVIASGLRNSTVFLYDLRSNESSLRLQHAQSVTKIRKVDSWRIVVGGHNTVSHRALPPSDTSIPLTSTGRNVRHSVPSRGPPTQTKANDPRSRLKSAIPFVPGLLPGRNSRLRREH